MINTQNNKQFYIVLIVMTLFLILIQVISFSEDSVLLNAILNDTLTRVIVGSLFAWILYRMGYRLFHLNKRAFLSSIIIIVPGIIIAINNFPISAFVNGRTSLEQPFYYVWLYLVECFSIGFFEEIVFRYVVLILIIQRLPNTKKVIFYSIVISSLVFGVIHFMNLFYGASFGNTLLQVGYSFMMGMLWAVVFLRTKNIVYPIILHALYNFFGQVMFTLGIVNNRYDTVTVIVTTVLALFAIIYYFNEFVKINVEDIKELRQE